jgi:large subunit ribosomal protein L17
MIKQLFEHERITTTVTKARAVRGEAERLITIARRSSDATEAGKVHARRIVASRLGSNQPVAKLFDDIAPRFAKRPGGYTRILKLGPRQGDGAEMAILEFVEE